MYLLLENAMAKARLHRMGAMDGILKVLLQVQGGERCLFWYISLPAAATHTQTYIHTSPLYHILHCLTELLLDNNTVILHAVNNSEKPSAES